MSRTAVSPQSGWILERGITTGKGGVIVGAAAWDPGKTPTRKHRGIAHAAGANKGLSSIIVLADRPDDALIKRLLAKPKPANE